MPSPVPTPRDELAALIREAQEAFVTQPGPALARPAGEMYLAAADALLAAGWLPPTTRTRIAALDVNQYSDAARPRVAEFKRRVLAVLDTPEAEREGDADA